MTYLNTRQRHLRHVALSAVVRYHLHYTLLEDWLFCPDTAPLRRIMAAYALIDQLPQHDYHDSLEEQLYFAIRWYPKNDNVAVLEAMKDLQTAIREWERGL